MRPFPSGLPMIASLLSPESPLAKLGAELLALHRQTPLPQAEIDQRKVEVETILVAAFGL